MNYKILQPKFIVCAFALAALTGCLYPHTSPRSPEVFGRILDARTHAPIHGAKVFLTEHPKVSCTTDTEGRFRLKETHNFHLLIFPPEGAGWPHGEDWWADFTITVSHTNYLNYRKDSGFTMIVQDWPSGAYRGSIFDAGDILLK